VPSTARMTERSTASTPAGRMRSSPTARCIF
jgi:hypothetical protein